MRVATDGFDNFDRFKRIQDSLLPMTQAFDAVRQHLDLAVNAPLQRIQDEMLLNTRDVEPLRIGISAVDLQPFAEMEQALQRLNRATDWPLKSLRAAVAGLDRLQIPALLTAYQSVGGIAFRPVEEQSEALTGLSPDDAELFAGVVSQELTAMAQSAPVEVKTADDVLTFVAYLAERVLSRLDELGIVPTLRAQIVPFLLALVAGVIAAEWQSYRNHPEHAERMREERHQIQILEKIQRSSAVGDGAPRQRATVTRNAHLRAEPGTSSRSFGLLGAGDEVIVLGRDGSWLFVTAGLSGGDLHEGWLYARFAKAIP